MLPLTPEKRKYWYNRLGWVKYSPMMTYLEYRKKLPRSIKPKRAGAEYFDIIIVTFGDHFTIFRIGEKGYMGKPNAVEAHGSYKTLKAAINNAGKIIKESGKPMP